jgi:hypothetical protein
MTSPDELARSRQHQLGRRELRAKINGTVVDVVVTTLAAPFRERRNTGRPAGRAPQLHQTHMRPDDRPVPRSAALHPHVVFLTRPNGSR